MSTVISPADLAKYQDNSAIPFLAKIVNEGHLVEFATLQPGVKYKAQVNVASADGNFQYGGVCAGSSDQATTSSFESRELLACRKTMFDSVCMNQLEEYYAGFYPAGNVDQANAVPELIDPLINSAVSHFQKQVETDLWNVAGTSLCDSTSGLYDIISGSTTGVFYSGSATADWAGDQPEAATLDNVVGQINTMYLNVPTDASDRDDLAIICSVPTFKKYLTALSTATGAVLGAYDVKTTVNGSLQFVKHPTVPNLTIYGSQGLGTSERIVAGPMKDIVVGTDLASDATSFQLWYDINDDTVKYRISAKFGANIANPTFWVSNDLA